MIALLDVNVLIALFDPVHLHHEAAHEWLAANRQQGWATCPITENGLARILSNPSYPGRGTTLQDALERLESFRRSGDHTFWPDSVSVRDPSLFRGEHIGGHRRLADVYLLALAVSNGGRLATFDRRISIAAAVGAKKSHLELIPQSSEGTDA